MGRVDRLAAILDILAEDGQVEVDELVRRLAISPATARRDLDTLAEQQLLSRTRGGAVAQTIAYDLPLRYKDRQFADQKLAIAQTASALVPRGAVVGLCGGTTATAIATVLMSRPDIMEAAPQPNLTVVTNALNIATQLSMRPQIKTVVTGGIVNTRSYELVGGYAESVLDRVTLDLAFIGANGIDPVRGPTSFDDREASVNALMASRAAKAIVVADSSKIDKTAFATIGRPGLFSTLITDEGITADQHARFTERGYDVIVAAL